MADPGPDAPGTPEDFFADHPFGLTVFRRVCAILDDAGPYTVRVTKSQVAFRRRRGFAYLWLPGRYLTRPSAEVVLSLALCRHEPSARIKQVAHPHPTVWMHHLEVRTLGELDGEVGRWLREAADSASAIP